MNEDVREHYNDVLERASRRGVTRAVEMMMINPGDIGAKFNVTPEWQRIRRIAHVAAIGRGLAAHGFTSPLILSARADGTYDVIDGCHRLTAVQHLGKSIQMAVEIYHGLTQYEARELFRCLSNTAKLSTGDFLRSYATESPLHQTYGTGRNERFPFGLSFKNTNRAKKVIDEISYDALLTGWFDWKKRRRGGKHRDVLLELWRSTESLEVMRDLGPVIMALQESDIVSPLFYSSTVFRVLLEIVEGSGFETFRRALGKLPKYFRPEGWEAIRHQNVGGLPEIRRHILAALNRKVSSAQHCVLPLWVLQRGEM